MPSTGETHCADWSIPYPDVLDETGVSRVLASVMQVDHDWSAFPWHVTGRLVELLEQPEPRFEYLHMTAFFRARAAMLALNGDVLNPKELHGSLKQFRVQAGGIYRRHLLRYLTIFLKKYNFAELPPCEWDPVDPQGCAEDADKNQEIIARVMRCAEGHYVNTLNFISMAADLEEQVCGHSVSFWVKGAEMPPPVKVRVQRRRHDVGYDLLPLHDEAKALIQAGRPPKKIVVRTQGELEFGTEVSSQNSEVRSQAVQTGRRGHKVPGGCGGDKEGLHHEGREEHEGKRLKVIGDYRVIMVPGHRQPINLAEKPKARQFLRFVHERLMKTGAADFYVEEMREAFNDQFRDDMAQRRWVSDRFREDLFRGKEREFDLLFERLDRGAGRYRMRVCGWLGFCMGVRALAEWSLGAMQLVADLASSGIGESGLGTMLLGA